MTIVMMMMRMRMRRMSCASWAIRRNVARKDGYAW